jgi:uncharacterized protein YkwD
VITAGVAPAFALARCAGADQADTPAHLTEARRATLCLLNAERRAQGLAPLYSERLLARAAQAHSRAMVQGGFFAHGAFAARLLPYTRGHVYWIGENIAFGTGALGRPRAIVRAWMRSPPHRWNILTGRFRQIGVGVAPGTPSGPSGATYTADFGRLSAAARRRPGRPRARGRTRRASARSPRSGGR